MYPAALMTKGCRSTKNKEGVEEGFQLSSRYMEKENTIKLVTCRYRNCLHDDKKLYISDAVKEGNMYYHPDCLQTKKEIKQIIDLFVEKVNPNPVYSQLQAVIKNIVFTKKVPSEFLLFGLRYYIKNKLNLNYPQGLYYVIQNKDVKAAYAKMKAEPVKKAAIDLSEPSTEVSFTHRPAKAKSIADILNG